MIYIIHCDGYCKIGYTRGSPRERLSQLQVGSPHEMTLMSITPGDLQTEADLHRAFASKRVRGEWFELTIEDIQWVRRIAFPEVLPELTRPTPAGDQAPIDLDDDALIDLGDDWDVPVSLE